MKTSDAPRMVKDTGKKIDWNDLIVGILVAAVMLPFGVAVLVSLWHQSDTGLGWAIFLFGLVMIHKYYEHGKMSALLGTMYSIALMISLWQQNLVSVISFTAAAILIEGFQFVSRKEKASKQ